MKQTLRCLAKTNPKSYSVMPSPQCKNGAWKDGYCKTHHPEEIKRRDESKIKTIKALQNFDPLRQHLTEGCPE